MIATLRQRNFALLWLGGLISQTGDWLLMIGLPVYVYVLTGSALATSITLITGYIPTLLLGSVAGVFVDRWDRRRTMIICNLLLAFGLLPLLIVHDKDTLWIVYVVQFFEACIAQFVLPAESALLPNLVSAEQLVSANALKSISTNTARLAGAALGGLLVGLLGLTSVTLLDAVSFLFVSAMIWLIRMPTKLESTALMNASMSLTASWRRLGREWLEGMQLIFRHRALAVLFMMIAAQSLGEGVFGVLLVVFVRKVLGGDAIVYGSLLSIQAVGSLIGGVIIGQVGNRLSPARLLGVGTFLFGIIDLFIINIPAFIPGLLVVIVLFALVGVPGTAAIVGFNSLFQVIVDDKMRGRIFGAFLAVEALLILIGMALAGVLGDRLGPVLLLNIQGSVYVLSGVLALLTLGRMVGKKQIRQKDELIV